MSLRASKTNVFQVGHSLLVGATGNLHVLCPVAAVLGYLAIRTNVSGPLFIHEEHISGASRTGSPCLGGGHTFITVLWSQFPDRSSNHSMIQTLGRWKSSAFIYSLKTGGHCSGLPPADMTGHSMTVTCIYLGVFTCMLSVESAMFIHVQFWLIHCVV